MKQLVSVDVTVTLRMYAESDEKIDEAMVFNILDELDYSFESTSENVTVVSTDMWDYDIKFIGEIKKG